MATPSRPIRKSAGVNPSPVGNGVTSGSVPMPTRRAAQPFGSVSKTEHKRPSAPISPSTMPINDKDAGRGTGSVR